MSGGCRFFFQIPLLIRSSQKRRYREITRDSSVMRRFAQAVAFFECLITADSMPILQFAEVLIYRYLLKIKTFSQTRTDGCFSSLYPFRFPLFHLRVSVDLLIRRNTLRISRFVRIRTSRCFLVSQIRRRCLFL